jgi:hypothetical protein
MKYSRKLVILSLFLTLLLAVISLPSFSIKIGEQEVTIPSIDLGLLVEGSNVGNFIKGDGIYNSKRMTYQTDTLYTQDLQVIKERLQTSGLTDISMSYYLQDGKTIIAFEFPNYYTDNYIQVITSLLVSRGNISFLQVDLEASSEAEEDAVLGYVPKDSGLTKSDILSVRVDRRNLTYSSTNTTQSFPGLDIVFKESDRLTKAFSDSGYSVGSDPDPMAISIDGSTELILQSLGDGKSVFAVPLYSLDTAVLRLMSGYLRESVGVNSIFSTGEISEIPASYATSGRTVLAAMFIITTIMLLLFLLFKEGKKITAAFAVALSFYIFLSVTLLKIGMAALSIGSMVAFMLMLIIVAITLIQLLKASTAQKETLKMSREIFTFIFLLTSLLYILNVTYGIFTEIVLVISMMSIAYLASSWLSIKAALGILNK